VVSDELFPETAPDAAVVQAVRAVEAPSGPLVERRPGWILVGSTKGPQGYHRAYGAGQNGTLITVCGVVGRRIDDAQTWIIECPACVQ
jgi:hypothetical protein